MLIEKVHNEIRYTLSNENLKVGDKVFPIASGRCLVAHALNKPIFFEDYINSLNEKYEKDNIPR